MKIAVIGTGYVGLVSGACFADIGNQVTCVDIVEEKIKGLNKGHLPFFEPDLANVIKRNRKTESIFFTTNLEEAVSDAKIIFITVGTPSLGLEGSVDLTYFFDAAAKVAKYLKSGSVIVGKSTVPIGTHHQLKKLIKSLVGDIKFDIVSNPEFLREGSAVSDFMEPDRIIIGAESNNAIQAMSEIYSPLTDRGSTISFSNFETAETIKYASNAFLATKISFINEIAALCDVTGADITYVSKGMGLDRRIGDQFLNAGPGYGGSCFPKDTIALAYAGRQYGVPQLITETVIEANEEAKFRVFQKIENIFEGDLKDKIISVFGVTFKPNTDDMREAPSLTIIANMLKAGAKIHVIDPEGKHFGETLLDGVEWSDDPYEIVENSDLMLILTDWDDFKNLNLKTLSSKMRSPCMLDCRNIYQPSEVLSSGFEIYYGNGRN